MHGITYAGIEVYTYISIHNNTLRIAFIIKMMNESTVKHIISGNVFANTFGNFIYAFSLRATLYSRCEMCIHFFLQYQRPIITTAISKQNKHQFSTYCTYIGRHIQKPAIKNILNLDIEIK